MTSAPSLPSGIVRVGEPIPVAYGEIAPLGQQGRGSGPPPEGQPPPVVKPPEGPPPEGPSPEGPPPEGPSPEGPNPTETHTCGAGGGEVKDFIQDIIDDLRKKGRLGPPPGIGRLEKIRDNIRKDFVQGADSPYGSEGVGGFSGMTGRLVAKILAPARIRWDRVLRGTLAGALDRLGAVGTPTYRRFSRRTYALHGSPSAYLAPAMTEKQPAWDIGLIVDTTSSVDAPALGVALVESAALITNPKIAKVFFAASSWAKAASGVIIASALKGNRNAAMKKLAPMFIGGGGDEIGPGMALIGKENRRRGAAGQKKIPFVVIFTDGYTAWPEEKAWEGAKVIIVLLPKYGQTVAKSTEDMVRKDASYATVILAQSGMGKR